MILPRLMTLACLHQTMSQIMIVPTFLFSTSYAFCHILFQVFFSVCFLLRLWHYSHFEWHQQIQISQGHQRVLVRGQLNVFRNQHMARHKLLASIETNCAQWMSSVFRPEFYHTLKVFVMSLSMPTRLYDWLDFEVIVVKWLQGLENQYISYWKKIFCLPRVWQKKLLYKQLSFMFIFFIF